MIDPGPRLDSHRDALAAALEGCTVRAILVTHCHADHSPLAAWLAGETGAPTFAFGPHGDERWDIGERPAGGARRRGTRGSGAQGAERRGTTTTAATEPVMEESTDRDVHP